MKFSNFPKLIFATSKSIDGNMSVIRGDKNEALKNRKNFLQKLDIDTNLTTITSLVHKTDIKKINSPSKKYIECDGLITSQKNLFLFMVLGDCLPIAFYDPKNNAIALVHGSWKTLDKGIIKNLADKMKKNFNTNPKDLIVEIGPSIGPCCYKLESPEQIDNPRWKPFIKFLDNKTHSIDLWAFTENELKNLGVLKDNITNQKQCTYHTREYFSHRKAVAENLDNDFRIASIFGMKN